MRIFILLIALLSLDQGVKYFASSQLNYARDYALLPDILHLRLLHNKGAAFSMFSEHTWLITLGSFLIILALIYLFIRHLSRDAESRLTRGFYLLIIAGGLGNLIDRTLYGYVIDFINFRILPGEFPIFNIADIYINLAFALLVLGLFQANKASS